MKKSSIGKEEPYEHYVIAIIVRMEKSEISFPISTAYKKIKPCLWGPKLLAQKIADLSNFKNLTPMT